ncbi:Cullin-domain-containing protein [Armillaria fumosa]|nr:Cullin-domain-containing protein [Armillaria fumosa]
MERGVDIIMTSPESVPPVRTRYYTPLYTTLAHPPCHIRPHTEFNKIEGTAGNLNLQIKDRRDLEFRGFRLYIKLTQYFVAYLKKIRDIANRLREEVLLTYHANEWRRYKAGVHYVHRLTLVQWKDHLLVPMQQQNYRLTLTLLHLVERQRNGETIDQSLLKRVDDSFVTLGLNDKDLNMRCLDIYKDHIETPFLAVTKTLYKKKSEAFLLENSVSDSHRKITEWIQEEKDRIEGYTAIETQTIIVSAFEEVFTYAYAHLQPPLSLICEVLALSQKFEDFKQAILDAVSTLIGDDGGAPGLQDYIDALFEIRSKDIVNQTGTSTPVYPELLVKHTDLLLRKNSKIVKERNLEGALDRVMVIFNYLEDKDIFQRLYAARLSKRLIYGASVSNESEAGIVSKLGEACGPEYTRNLQKMLTDIKLSKDLTDESNLERRQDPNTDLTFSVAVLGTNSWLLDLPSHKFTIPRDIYPTYHRFQQYYQMAILVVYSSHDTLSLTELVTATSIPREVITQILAILVKARILVNEESEQYDLNPSQERINLNGPIITEELGEVLKNVEEDRKYVIQASIIHGKSSLNKMSDPQYGDAVNIRGAPLANGVMEAWQSMKNQQVIQEVILQLSQQFTPNVADIEKAIGILLEKEYIERVHGMKDHFAYIA